MVLRFNSFRKGIWGQFRLGYCTSLSQFSHYLRPWWFDYWVLRTLSYWGLLDTGCSWLQIWSHHGNHWFKLLKLLNFWLLLNFTLALIFSCIFSRYTMVPASLYLGFAASIIWVGQVQKCLLNLPFVLSLW